MRLTTSAVIGLLLLAIAEGLFAAGSAAAERQVGVLRGRVVDAQTGEVVARARLRLTTQTMYSMTVVADDLGAYLLTGVPVGAATLIVSASGYRDYVQNVQVFGAEQTLDILLEPVSVRGLPSPVKPVPATTPPWDAASGEKQGLRSPIAPLSQTATTASSLAGPDLYAAGGYAELSPREFNDVLEDANQFWGLAQEWLKLAGYTTQLDTFEQVDGGFWGEGGLRMTRHPVLLSVGVQYLRPAATSARLDSSATNLFMYDSGWIYDSTYTSSPYYDSNYDTYVYTTTYYYERQQTYGTGSDTTTVSIGTSVIGPVGQAGLTFGQHPMSLSLSASVGYFWLFGESTSRSSSEWTYDTVASTRYSQYVYCYSSYYGYYYWCDYNSGSFVSGTTSSSEASSDEAVTRFRDQTLGWGARLVLSLSLSETAALEAGIGYQNLRFERLTEEETGEPLTDLQGTAVPLDLSGVRASIGLTVHF